MARQQRTTTASFPQESPTAIARVALYARVSTLNNQDPEMQLGELREYAGRRGWQIVEEFTDQGVSGCKESRPALNRLMSGACRRRFDAILVWKIDRFGRSLKHLVNALAELAALGVAFISLRDNLDLSTPSGRLMGTPVRFDTASLFGPVRGDVTRAKAIHSAFMPRPRFFRARLAFAICAILSPTLSRAEKKQLPAVRWTAGAPGCTFERGDDGRYRWTMAGNDLKVTLLVDSQELSKSRRRFYRLLGMYLSVTYTGHDKFEFPADVRIDFVRHHDVLEAYEDPTELSNKLQNDLDTLVFDTERQIKKNPKITEERTALLREREKEAAEFIEFLGTQSLEPATVTLTPGNPEAHGWVFFATRNKWIGPWKEREDFIVGVWMKDKVWQFPFSLPPAEGDLILRKPPE